MKRNFEFVAKKQQKQKNKFRNQDQDQFGPRRDPRYDYKRKPKHKTLFDWNSEDSDI